MDVKAHLRSVVVSIKQSGWVDAVSAVWNKFFPAQTRNIVYLL